MLAEAGARWMDFGRGAGNAGRLGGRLSNEGGEGSNLCVFVGKSASVSAKWVTESSRAAMTISANCGEMVCVCGGGR